YAGAPHKDDILMHAYRLSIPFVHAHSHPHSLHSHQEHTSLSNRLQRSVHCLTTDRTYEQGGDNTVRKKTRLLKTLHQGETVFFLLHLWVVALVCLAAHGKRNTAASKRWKTTRG